MQRNLHGRSGTCLSMAQVKSFLRLQPCTINNVPAEAFCVHTDSSFCSGWVAIEAFDLNSKESCWGPIKPAIVCK